MTTLRIESLTLEGVGCFGEAFTATFAPDELTIVHGPNEAGKSTLLAGIPAVLFGVEARYLDHWRSDPERSVCSGTLRVRTGEDRFTIARDFVRHRVLVTDASGGVVLDGEANPAAQSTGPAKRAYQAWLRDRIGMDQAETFQDTAFFHLREIKAALSYSSTVREMVSGAGAEDFTDVQQDLLDQFEALTKENPWGARAKTKPREIERVREHLEARRRTLQEAETASEQRRAAQDGLQRAETELAEAQEAAAQAEAAVKRLLEVQRLHREAQHAQDAWNRAHADQQRASELGAQLKSLLARLDTEFADVQGVTEAHVKALAHAEQTRAEAERLEERAQAYPEPSPPTMHVSPILLAGGLAVLAGVAVALIVWWVGVAVGVAGLSVAGVFYARAAKQYRTERQRFEQASEIRREALATADAARAAAVEAVRAVPEAVRGRGSAEVSNQILVRQSVEDAWAEKRAERERMPATSVLAAALSDATRELGVAQSRLEELGATHLDGADLTLELQEQHLAKEKATARREELERRIRGANRVLGGVEHAGSASPAILKEEIADLEERLAALEGQRDALQVAIDTLHEAATAFQQDHVGPIGTEATRVFRELTRDGWEVTVAQEGLAPQLTWQGRPWDPVRLSAGTRDQLAVALRLAVIRALHHSVRVPVILDDPLAHWDADRRAALRRTLGILAESHQVILATPDSTLAAWGTAAVAVAGADALAARARTDYTPT